MPGVVVISLKQTHMRIDRLIMEQDRLACGSQAARSDARRASPWRRVRWSLFFSNELRHDRF